MYDSCFAFVFDELENKEPEPKCCSFSSSSKVAVPEEDGILLAGAKNNVFKVLSVLGSSWSLF